MPAAHEFILRLGPTPVIVTAPHAVSHWRTDRWKLADRFSGQIALELARDLNASSLIVSADTFEDGNFIPDGQFKSLVSLIAAQEPVLALIDIHGMADRSGVVTADRDLASANALRDPQDAEDYGVRLVLPSAH
jgi:hypothetical protein